MHDYLGPSKLRKDGEPAAKEGRKFWAAFTEWQKLTDVEKEETKVF